MTVRTRNKQTLVPYLDSDGIVNITNLEYVTPLDAIISTSPTFDYDSATNYTMANTIETMDADRNYYWSEIDSDYASQIIDRSV